MEEKGKFLQDLTTLLKIAKTNDNCITKEEIQDFFADMELGESQWSMIYQYITSQDVKIIGYEKLEVPVVEEDFSEENPIQDAIVTMYMEELKDKKDLTPEQEQFVAKKMLAGDENARKLLIESNLNLVTKLAHEYKNRSLPEGDLIQEGNIGLLMGVSEYELSSKVTFHQYITDAIRRAIEGALSEDSRETMSAKKIASRANELNDLATEMAGELEREATPKELAKRMGLTEDEVLEIMKISLDAVSVLEPNQRK
ncbi:MAG: sigma-70 domain-containing protein [Lachnospiraceae bacterium]|nr:sigma-70 domain-containing protein [Lachnospiraceae bacterium]